MLARHRRSLLTLPLAFLLAGCAQLRAIKVFNVEILNNEPYPVVVKDCNTSCSILPIVINLAPGTSSIIHETTGQTKYMWVFDSTGQVLGCLNLFFNTVKKVAILPISSKGACPGVG